MIFPAHFTMEAVGYSPTWLQAEGSPAGPADDGLRMLPVHPIGCARSTNLKLGL